MGQAPERNFRNELAVAVVALVMLAITILLAILLAEGSTSEVLTTATTQSMSSTEVSAALTPIATMTQASATPDPTATSTREATEPSTPTATRRVTSTRRPTTTPTDTATSQPSPTTISTRTATTAATDTPTKRPSAASTPTDRPTRTTLPTLTPTVAPTSTPLPATATPATSATIALVTPQTPTGTTLVSTAVETCPPPAGWVPYTIQAGDNLFRISLRANIPLSEMQEKNCIVDPTRIEVGQVIHVPDHAPILPTADEPGTPSTTQPATPSNDESTFPIRWGCSLPGVQITAPTAGRIQPLNAPFQVSGLATLPDADFHFYKVELRRENEDLFRNLVESTIPVTSPGPLTLINPADFGAGHYQIVLTVVDNTGNYPEPCAVRVTFR